LADVSHYYVVRLGPGEGSTPVPPLCAMTAGDSVPEIIQNSNRGSNRKQDSIQNQGSNQARDLAKDATAGGEGTL
jgi:hypothetical protein